MKTMNVICFILVTLFASQAFADPASDCMESISRLTAMTNGMVNGYEPSVISGKDPKACALTVFSIDPNAGNILLTVDDLKTNTKYVFYVTSADQMSTCKSDASSVSASGGTLKDFPKDGAAPITQSFSVSHLASDEGPAGGLFTLTNNGKSFSCQF